MNLGEKDTEKLSHELKQSTDFFASLKQNDVYFVENDVATYLTQLLKEKNMSKAHVIKAAAISEVTGYQYFDGKRKPPRAKLIALCIGFSLDDEETNILLKRSGYARLYAKHLWDAIIIYGLSKKYDIEKINHLLYEKGLETLGDS